MRQSIFKLSHVNYLPFSGYQLAPPLLPIVHIATLISNPIVVGVDTMAVLEPILELPLVNAGRLEHGSSLVELVLIVESSIVCVGEVILGPFQDAVEFVSLSIESFEGMVGPFFLAPAFEEVVLEGPFVGEIMGVVESVFCFCLVVEEEAFVVGSIGKDEYSFAMSFSRSEAANVD